MIQGVFILSANVEDSKITFAYLRKFNLAMGILHLIQGLLILTLGIVVENVRDFSIDIYTFYLGIKELRQDGPPLFEPEPEVFFTFQNIAGILLSTFLLMSALAHLLIAFPLNDYYETNLRKKMNPLRWYEYAFSSSVMIIFIALAFGILSFWLMFAIFVLNGLMNMFGLMMEKLNQYTEKTDWTPYFLGWIAGAAPWVIIFDNLININTAGREVPTFVYVAFAMYFIFFNSFAVNMFLQYKKVGPWKDYLYGERWYQLLSLFAKSSLGWIVFMGLFFG